MSDFHWDLDVQATQMLLKNRLKRATDKILGIFNRESDAFLLLKYKML